MDTNLAVAYRNPPKKIRVGRVLMAIGSVLFFVSAIIDILLFSVAFVPADPGVDWSDVGVVLQLVAMPFLAVFFILAGIGGLCFITDKGGRLRCFASLAAIVMLVVFIIDTVLSIRSLVRGIVMPVNGQTNPWISFLIDLFDIQLSGGIYILGWFLVKDFVGD